MEYCFRTEQNAMTVIGAVDCRDLDGKNEMLQQQRMKVFHFHGSNKLNIFISNDTGH